MARYYSVTEVLNMILDGNASDMEQLAEDDDDEEEVEEEWTPPARIDEKSDSSDDEEDLEASEEDTPNPNETKTKQSTSSKVKRKEYQWKKKKFEAPAVEFEECVDENSGDRLTWTPYMYFKDFVTEEMLQEIAEETNLYSVQKDGKSVNTNAKEIEQILGMYMHMGLNQMPNVRAYWEMETRCPAVCDVMSRGRFLKLLTLLHFQDNLNVSEDAKKDKLWKLRSWLEQLRQRFLSIPPEECHAVDEIMVPFKGKSQLRCYMPGKPHRWGFKMWGRAGQSGYLYDFDVCQGAEHPDKEKSDVGASGDVVLKMTSTLPAGKNHKVFADNYFTSVPLVEHLKQRGIYYIGTVRMNRVKNCQLMDEKDLKKKGRGSLDFRVNQEDLIIVKWFDNKAVNLISSFVGIEPLGNVKRWDRKAKSHIMVSRPAIVDTYNRFMGGVDLLDIPGRSKTQPETLPLRRVQASVATSLTSAGKGKKCGRPLSSPEATPTPPRKRKSTVVPPDVIRDGIDHFPTWETRQRCKHCTGHFSHVYCVKCSVHLCLNKDRNCFLAYHHAK
uniref:PiggyBac transposable element-derived protein domain-containing protein n=1 Tax=Anabas testudineus TaxID=64144 RepID=A0A3Q1JQK9_ANATE